jgi:two-component system nitrate/nitrite response regulator NarL
MVTAKPNRVIIADDHPLYRGALVTILNRVADIDVLEPVASLDEALESIRRHEPALALLDLDMPGMSSQAVTRIREIHPQTLVAIISGTLSPSKIREALSAGACGYLPKTFSPDMIRAAITLMLSGAIYVPPNVLADAPESASEPSGAADGPRAALTPREQEVLEYLAKGLANKEIARQLGLAEVTVKLHTRRILEKLRVRNRTAAAALAISQGLVAGETAS